MLNTYGSEELANLEVGAVRVSILAVSWSIIFLGLSLTSVGSLHGMNMINIELLVFVRRLREVRRLLQAHLCTVC